MGAKWIRAWRLELDAGATDTLQQWLAREWCVLDDGSLPLNPLVHLVAGEARVICGEAEYSEKSQGDLSKKHGATRQLTADGHKLQLHLLELEPARADSPIEYSLCASDGGCRFVLNPAGVSELIYWGTDPRIAVYTALCEIFRCAGWFSIHASGVIDTRHFDGAHLFLGRSGAGKSFRLLQAIAEGSLPIGEDRVWYCVDEDRVAARDDSVRVNHDAFEQFSWLKPSDAVLDPDGKHKVSYKNLHIAPAAPALLRSYSILRMDKPPTALQIAAHLWEALGLPFSDTGKAATERAINRLMGKSGELTKSLAQRGRRDTVSQSECL